MGEGDQAGSSEDIGSSTSPSTWEPTADQSLVSELIPGPSFLLSCSRQVLMDEASALGTQA